MRKKIKNAGVFLSEKVVNAIKKDNKCIANLMVLYDVTQMTILNMLKRRDPRLLHPSAVDIIMRCTGYNHDQLFEGETPQINVTPIEDDATQVGEPILPNAEHDPFEI